MDPRLLDHYNRELQHVREMGGEFAAEYPKIAGRLGMDGIEVADPYVERLLEGFAFLTARVQLKLEDQFPRFTQHLLEMVYPHYLAPTPSMMVVQMHPDCEGARLDDGFTVPRGASLRAMLGRGEQTACEYRTAHEVTLWPLEVAHASYGAAAGGARLRLRLRALGGARIRDLGLDRLPLFLSCPPELRDRLYEQMLAHTVDIEAGDGGGAPTRVPGASIEPLGFEDGQALLPHGPRSFAGYRLLKEYFDFPERYAFVELRGLRDAFARAAGTTIEIHLRSAHVQPRLEQALHARHFALHCTPAINLFERRADRVHLNERDHEYHVVPDRTRPMDFEVFDVQGVEGIGSTPTDTRTFAPFYAHKASADVHDRAAFFTLRREPRRLSSSQRRTGARSSYVGSESYISLVDGRDAPLPSRLRQLDLRLRCTNRDLPLHMPTSTGRTDFQLGSGAPVTHLRCIAGPTRPRSPLYGGDARWRLVSHLSLNYLSLARTDSERGGAALRELLMLYTHGDDPASLRQADAVLGLECRSTTRRLPMPGPITFGRGLEAHVTLDESALAGPGLFLFGAVLEQFIARYASINAFTQTVVHSNERGEVVRWPVRAGVRPTL